MSELVAIKGVGPGKAQKLEAAGYTTVQSVAQLDLRKRIEIDGVSQDFLKTAKANARALLKQRGIPVEKSAYTTSTVATTPSGQKAPRRSFWSRIFARKTA